MTLEWWFERFGAVGLMLAAMLYDRNRLLKEIGARDVRIEMLTERLIAQSTEGLAEAIRREQQVLDWQERIYGVIKKEVE